MVTKNFFPLKSSNNGMHFTHCEPGAASSWWPLPSPPKEGSHGSRVIIQSVFSFLPRSLLSTFPVLHFASLPSLLPLYSLDNTSTFRGVPSTLFPLLPPRTNSSALLSFLPLFLSDSLYFYLSIYCLFFWCLLSPPAFSFSLHPIPLPPLLARAAFWIGKPTNLLLSFHLVISRLRLSHSLTIFRKPIDPRHHCHH